MIRDVIRLFKRRLVRHNYLDTWYFLTHSFVIVGLSTAWMVSIGTRDVISIVLAASIGVIAEVPLILFHAWLYSRVISKKAARPPIQIFFVGLNAYVFIQVFYLLSPNQDAVNYNGILIGWLNQFLAATYLYLIYAFVRGSFLEFKYVSQSLDSAISELEHFEKTSERKIVSEENSLRKKAQETLLPVIQEISDRITIGSSASATLAERIQQVLRYTVKPLGYELRKSIDIEIETPQFRARKMSAWGSIPIFFNPRDTFSPLLSGLLFIPALISATISTSQRSSLVFTMICICILWLSLESLKFLLPNREVYWLQGFARQQGVVWAALGIVQLFALVLSPIFNESPSFTLRIAGLISMATATFTYLAITEISMATAKKTSELIHEKLAQTHAYFLQRLWIAKRNWSYLVHGRIQSHLLASQVILRNKKASNEQVKELNYHLDEVIELLRKPPKPDVDLLKEISDLEQTWRGIASINFKFQKETLEVLETDSSLRFAVNEILREAVSNSVKHSEATLLDVEVKLENRAVLIQVSSDGKPPKAESSRSLGSIMLDELASDWNLDFDKKAKRITLSAWLTLSQNFVN